MKIEGHVVCLPADIDTDQIIAGRYLRTKDRSIWKRHVFEDLDPADPFRSMARAYSDIFICRSDDRKEMYIEQMVARFKVDGVLYHDAKTCPNNSNSRYGLPQRLEKKLGKPHLAINGDLNDLRLYSEEQTRTNIEAFVEQLLQA